MVPSDDLSLICPIDSNDRIGNVIKFYNPVDYGAGAHTSVVSSTTDFILRYTITVKPPPATNVNRQLDSSAFLNHMQQNNTFTFNKAK
jgi:hypothetical protein